MATLIDGYDRKKAARRFEARALTFDDMAALQYGHEYWFVSHGDGKARRCRVSSAVKRWQTRPADLEVSVKYGMYESCRIAWRNGERIDGPALYVETPTYTVIVGNVGTVYDGTDAAVAQTKFHTYIEASKSDVGRASGESVTLMRDGEIVDEYTGIVETGE